MRIRRLTAALGAIAVTSTAGIVCAVATQESAAAAEVPAAAPPMTAPTSPPTGGCSDCPDPTVMGTAVPGWTQAGQDRLSAYSDRIAATLATDPDFAIAQLDYAHDAVKVYYAAAALPASIASIEATAAQDGVTIELGQVRYSTATLDAATEKLEAAGAASGLVWSDTEQATTSGGLASGLSVAGLPGGTTAVAKLLALAAKTIPGIPVSVLQGQPTPQAAVGRQADNSPWSGGARIRTSDGGCTSGFATSNGSQAYLLTAGHCTEATNNVNYSNGWTGGALGYSVGAGTFYDDDVDAELIHLNSNAGSYEIYSGDWNTPALVPINGTGNVAMGQAVITGGASTGSHYSATLVSGTREHIAECPGCTKKFYVYRIHSSDGSSIVGYGDSGGSLYTHNTTTDKRYGVGIVTAEFDGTACGSNVDPNASDALGNPLPGSTGCGSVEFYTTMAAMLVDMHKFSPQVNLTVQ